MVSQSITIVDEDGNAILELDKNGITFTAPTGEKALIRLRVGTDADSVKFEVVNMPLTPTNFTLIDNIT